MDFLILYQLLDMCHGVHLEVLYEKNPELDNLNKAESILLTSMGRMKHAIEKYADWDLLIGDSLVIPKLKQSINAIRTLDFGKLFESLHANKDLF
jgi:hypothetical protein